ncbi:MAG TPA: hypothetical protein VGL86_22480 [Polyangia bacterium]|jgi:hypothetical protein
MRRSAAAVLGCALAACAGCYSPIDEIVATHITPGGTVSATLDASPAYTTTALADATAQPMTLEGTSPALVFGLIFGTDDLTGLPAHDQLLVGAGVQMTVTPSGTVQLSVHAGGGSCAATTGTVIHLISDGNGHLNGDFSGSGDTCQAMSGTFASIPLSQ